MNDLPIVTDTRALTLPFMAGVYLAVNAIEGARIVVDGPMCAFYKAEYIQGNHQIVADLQRLASPHRVLHSELDIHRAILGDETLVHDKVRLALEDSETQALFFSAMSSAMLIGRDIERLLHAADLRPEVPRIPVPSRSLSGDWNSGWRHALAAIADAVPLAPRTPGDANRPRVGIVGNLFLRHEGDAAGDVQELARMVQALGAQVVSIWLAGDSWRDLGAIGQADLLVALPYAQTAAQRLAQRVGVPVVPLPLPFSWTLTERFLLGLGEALDRVPQAQAFLEREKDRWAAELLFRAEHHLQGTRWIVVDDPVRMAGWVQIAQDCGATLQAAGLTAAAAPGVPPLAGQPQPVTLLHQSLAEGRVDVFIANSIAADMVRHAPRPAPVIAEFGYPCFGRHPVAPIPSLGFPGAVATVETICERIRSRRESPS